MTAILTGKDLRLDFGATKILRGVDVDIAPGEIVAVMGASGSGKSTLLHVLAGLLQPHSGVVELKGARIDNLSEKHRSAIRLRELGFVFQTGDLVPELSVVENVELPLRLTGIPARKARSNAWQKGEGSYLSPSEVTLMGQRGQITLPLSETEVQVDLEATQARFLKGATVDEHILIPPTYAGVSKVLGPPRSYAITADGGRAVQVSLSQFAQQNGFEAVLPPSQTYEKTMLGRAALLTVIPMVLSVALAVLNGSLSAQVFSVLLRFEGLGVGDPINFTADILWVAIPLVIACIGVALATLPGLGARLRPEVLRRD